ncbi:hypothetical protein [Streptomyces sp. NPDC059819]
MRLRLTIDSAEGKEAAAAGSLWKTKTCPTERHPAAPDHPYHWGIQ